MIKTGHGTVLTLAGALLLTGLLPVHSIQAIGTQADSIHPATGLVLAAVTRTAPPKEAVKPAATRPAKKKPVRKAAPPKNTGTGIAKKKLRHFHKNVKSFKANFRQVLKDPGHSVLQSSSGIMFLKRPGLFRWDYSKPDRQLIISNGKKLWIYDEGLEQVTVKTLKKGLGQTPARVLSESRALEKEFHIKDLGKISGIYWVELKPKRGGSNFQWVRIGFQKTLSKMLLKDNLNQTTEIDFTEFKMNPTLKSSLFTFTPPKGVDVVGDPTLINKNDQ